MIIFPCFFLFLKSCSNKKVIYSLNWSKEDMSAAASREIPMTKQVVDSLVNLGEPSYNLLLSSLVVWVQFLL